MVGLIDTSIFNILSSNVINLIQYSISVRLNKNKTSIQNKAIKIDLFLVITTIIIPIAMLIFQVEANINIVPIFVLLFIFFYFINHNAHKLYLHNEEKMIAEDIEKEQKWLKGKKRKTILYTILSVAYTHLDVYKRQAYALTFRSNEKTLNEEEINTIMGNIIEDLQKELGAELRK